MNAIWKKPPISLAAYQDLVGRDGQTYGTDAASVAAFENTWRSAPNESLLPPPSDATRQLIAH